MIYHFCRILLNFPIKSSIYRGIAYSSWNIYRSPQETLACPERILSSPARRRPSHTRAVPGLRFQSSINCRRKFTGLEKGNVWRKSLCFMGKSMVSGRLSLKPIDWKTCQNRGKLWKNCSYFHVFRAGFRWCMNISYGWMGMDGWWYSSQTLDVHDDCWCPSITVDNGQHFRPRRPVSELFWIIHSVQTTKRKFLLAGPQLWATWI